MVMDNTYTPDLLFSGNLSTYYSGEHRSEVPKLEMHSETEDFSQGTSICPYRMSHECIMIYFKLYTTFL